MEVSRSTNAFLIRLVCSHDLFSLVPTLLWTTVDGITSPGVFLAIARNHEVGEVKGQVEMNSTCIPDLPKLSRIKGTSATNM